MQWFDTASGEGRIIRNGRRYSAQADSVEPAARVAGARVHFDIGPDRDGSVATDVRLRPGTRVSRRQRRFGDLTGAATTDAKGSAPFATAHPEVGHDLQRHPMRVAEAWAQLLADGDVDGALLLYAPDAALHVGGDVAVGPRAIRAALASALPDGVTRPFEVRGDATTVMIRWDADREGSSCTETRLRIGHGEVAEQWLGSVTQVERPVDDHPPIEVSADKGVSAADRQYAVDKTAKVLGTVDEPVRQVMIRIDVAPDPARQYPARVRVMLDLDGDPVRLAMRAGTVPEAVDLLEPRLRRRLQHVVEHRRTLRRRSPGGTPGAWRHGDPATPRVPFHPRAPEDRKVVRRKTLSAGPSTVDEAVFDLESLDHDFFLFEDLASGQDTLVARQEDGSYALTHLLGPGDLDAPATVADVHVDDRAALVATEDEAREHLDLGRAPSVFFKDEATGRGHVLYRRYDGHYGLILPTNEPPGS